MKKAMKRALEKKKMGREMSTRYEIRVRGSNRRRRRKRRRRGEVRGGEK